MFKMLVTTIHGIFKLFREEIHVSLNLFRKLVHIKSFQMRKNIMPKDGSHLGYSLFRGVCSNS